MAIQSAEEIRSKFTNPNRGRDLRRVHPGALRKSFMVSTMSEKHHQVARLVSLGLKNTEIAKQTGLNSAYITQIRNSPVVQEQIMLLRGVEDKRVLDVNKRIINLCNTSIDIFEKILNEGELDNDVEKQRLQFKAAEGMLDRGGYAKHTNTHVTNTNLHVTGDQLLEIKQRAIAAGAVIEDDIEEAEILKEEGGDVDGDT